MYTYDYANRLTKVEENSATIGEYVYDGGGRRIQVTESSVTTTYIYSGKNVLYEENTTGTASYTNGPTATDPGNDWLSRLTKVEEEYATDLFAVTTYQYDEVSFLTSFTDAENHATSYTYGSLFGLTKTTYPDSTYEECEYDDVGNLASFTDANGNETVYTYDSIYRLTQIQYQDQSTVSLTYDLNSNRTRMDDNAPNTGDYVEYSYDYLSSVWRIQYRRRLRKLSLH